MINLPLKALILMTLALPCYGQMLYVEALEGVVMASEGEGFALLQKGYRQSFPFFKNFHGNRYLVSTPDALYFASAGGYLGIYHFSDSSAVSKKLSLNRISGLVYEDNQLLLSSQQGLWQYDVLTEQVISLDTTVPINRIFRGSDSNVYFLSSDQKLYYGAAEDLKPVPLKINRVWTSLYSLDSGLLLKDSEGFAYFFTPQGELLYQPVYLGGANIVFSEENKRFYALRRSVLFSLDIETLIFRREPLKERFTNLIARQEELYLVTPQGLETFPPQEDRNSLSVVNALWHQGEEIVRLQFTDGITLDYSLIDRDFSPQPESLEDFISLQVVPVTEEIPPLSINYSLNPWGTALVQERISRETVIIDLQNFDYFIPISDRKILLLFKKNTRIPHVFPFLVD